MSTATRTHSIVLIERSWEAAQKSGNVYQHRVVCTCGYRSNWTPKHHALDLATDHLANADR